MTELESIWLEFDAYMDQVSTSIAARWENQVSYTRFYNSKIESFGLELLDTQIVSKLC